MRLALFEPDIPQNTGTIMRLCACLGAGLDIIEPCGFILDDRKLKRAGMDYIDLIQKQRHINWTAFMEAYPDSRFILLTTKTDQSYLDFTFEENDILILGRESKGATDQVHQDVDARITIPMHPEARSLNVALSAAIVLGEAIRQTNSF